MYLNGEKLKQLRHSKKLSRFQLSLDVDLSPRTIQYIEERNHRCGVTLDTAIKLSKFFEVTVEEFI